ncbi:heparinase II/III domain-containing protein [Paenibacillus oceani]|uniref:Heparinase II/III family protein n=1 Tax=Paenibacillus oceani TaxID=2772510 RepID=A0A927CCH2_9BACL|nr:heparinase II/III family protein [Paenibacillus oceani]MBD2865529.1 heparinase II/III family protein [Paenibacillus oceani]
MSRRRSVKVWSICLCVWSLLVVQLAWAEPDAPAGGGGGQTMDSEVLSFTNRIAIVPQTGHVPAVDGTMEPLWQSAFQADGFVTMFDNRPAGSGTKLYLLYDDANLYLGLEGLYEQPGTAPDTEIVEVLLAPGTARADVYRLTIPIASGDRPIRSNWGTAVKELQGAAVQIGRGAGSWTAEVRVPFQSLGKTEPAEGEMWSFNLMRYFGINSEPFSSWAPIRSSYIVDQGGSSISLVSHVLNESRMAPLYFVSTPPLHDAPGSRTERWQPPNGKLTYVNYTTKQFAVNGNAIHNGTEVRLAWISPDGVTTRLEPPAVEKLGGQTFLTFNHPKPLAAGQYRLQAGFRQGNGIYHYFELSFDRNALIEAGDKQASGIVFPAGPIREVANAPASSHVETVMRLIPEKTGFIFTGLPENPTLSPYQLYSWNVQNPNQIVSKTTGTVYPNSTYPETHKLTVTNRKGETVEYPYYEDGEGRKYFLTAHLWYFQKDYTLRETAKIAATDPLGAALLLNRWADVYAGYLPTNDYYWTNYPVVGGPPYHYWGGVWYRWYTGEMTNMSYLINAYRDVRKTNAFALLSAELGFDVEKKLVETVFEPSFDFVRSFPVLNHNMEYTTWLGLVRMAKASGQPAYMHEAVDLIQDFAANNFLSDGFWKEVTLSYHNQSINGLVQSMEEAKGWSDPTGYLSPRDGQRLDNVDMTGTYPALGNALNMKNVVAYPNGSYVPIQDTWANEKTALPRTDLGSYLLPGSGISRLALGTGGRQLQTYLQFTPKDGHNHYDPLNLTLFAQGQELLPDIGYTHTFYRRWTSSTLAHNMVIVDGADMKLSGQGLHGGRIESLVTGDSGVQIVRASQPDAYPVTDEYSREPWVIPFGDGESAEDGYVVDLFRIAGGSRHEYTLGGDANRDGVFTTDAAIEPYGPYLLPEGTQVTMPESENDTGSAQGNYYGYIYVQDVQRAEIPDGRYQVTLETSDNGTDQGKLAITGFTDASGENELFIGRSPSLRATRLSGTSKDINTEAVKYWMPKLVVRRSGTNLSSTFVHIIEPYKGAGPKIESVEKLVPDLPQEGGVALQIRYGAITDTVLSSSEPGATLKVGDMELNGKYGFIRTENGTVTKMVLSEGTLLRKGGETLTGPGPATGTVTDVMRIVNGDPADAIVTETAVPASYTGSTVVVTHPDGKTHGYKVKEIRRESGKAWIVLDHTDPGWDYRPDGSSRMTSHPFLEWQGMHTFRIGNVSVR